MMLMGNKDKTTEVEKELGLVWAPAEEIPPLSKEEILSLYQKAFSILNRDLFDEELPPVRIEYPASITDDKKLQDMLYEDANENDYTGFYSRFIADDSPVIVLIDLEFPAEGGLDSETVSLLFHEMTHYYCDLHNIKDTTDHHQYHTIAFKDAIEKHGGMCKYKDPQKGYTDTSLPVEYLNTVFDELDEL